MSEGFSFAAEVQPQLQYSFNNLGLVKIRDYPDSNTQCHTGLDYMAKLDIFLLPAAFG